MAHAQTAPGFDPRRTITPESFHVAPHLLGLPLASPWRRLAAILLDLLLVAILANSGKVVLAIALSLTFFWIAGKRLGKGGGFFSRTARMAFRGFGALFILIAFIAVWNSARSHMDHADEGDGGGRPAQAAMSTTGSRREQHVSVLSAAQVALAVNALEHADDSASAYAATARAVRQLRRMNATDAEIREGLQDEVRNRPAAVRAGFMAALPSPDTAKPAADSTAPADSVAAAERSVAAAAAAGPDSLAAVYVAAVHGGDSARATEVRPKLASLLARDSLDELRGRVTELQNDKQQLERQKEAAENRGLLSILLEWLDDLGIGIGWTGLYFTALTALMKGQTPAKKLFGIRVLRLDGLPMTLWASFERFGGYAAGLFTGLTGYAQVFWDRNRQAIQDKISETVVIRERRGIPVPTAPAPSARPLPPRWPPAGVGAP